MLHSLDIPFDLIRRNAEDAEKFRQDAVPMPNAERSRLSRGRQSQAAISFVIQEARLGEALDHRGYAGGRDVELLRNVGHAGVTLPLDELVNPFEIVLPVLG